MSRGRGRTDNNRCRGVGRRVGVSLAAVAVAIVFTSSIGVANTVPWGRPLPELPWSPEAVSRFVERDLTRQGCSMGAAGACQRCLDTEDPDWLEWALDRLAMLCDAGDAAGCGALAEHLDHGSLADRREALGIRQRLCDQGDGAACRRAERDAKRLPRSVARPVEPPAPPGELSLRARPEATVRYAGRVLGKTPLTHVSLPSGCRNLELIRADTGKVVVVGVQIPPRGHARIAVWDEATWKRVEPCPGTAP